MARYVTSVASPLSAAEAFAYMADVTHFAEWDPGVKRAVRVKGDGTGVGTAYDLTVQAGGTTVMRYTVKECEAPRRILLVSYWLARKAQELSPWDIRGLYALAALAHVQG